MHQLEILTQNSTIDILKHFDDDNNIIKIPFLDLVKKFNLTLINRYEIDLKISLEMPIGNDLRDLQNCAKILKILPNLTPADATDERLWVTLCFHYFKDYTLARWDKGKLRNHIFGNNWRQRISDNSISRLWWVSNLTNRISEIEPNANLQEYLSILLNNSDYRSSLIERSSSANCTNVFLSILQISDELEKSKGITYNRDKFRNFMKEVTFIERRHFLPIYNVANLKKMLTPIYIDCYK